MIRHISIHNSDPILWFNLLRVLCLDGYDTESHDGALRQRERFDGDRSDYPSC